MLEVTLLRHPRTHANEEGIIQGTLNTVLIPGWEHEFDDQIKILAEEGPFAAVTASFSDRSAIPGSRAYEMLKARQAIPIDFFSTTLFYERDWGHLQGKRYDGVPRGGMSLHEYLYLLDEIRDPKGDITGENLRMLQGRADRARSFLEYYNEPGVTVRVLGIDHEFFRNYSTNRWTEGNVTAHPYRRIANMGITRLQLDGQRVVELVQ